MANKCDVSVPSLRVLVGCTGSVATIKLPLLLSHLLSNPNIEVKVVVTDRACHFFSHTDLPEKVRVYSDKDEWNMWSTRGDPVLHIDLVKWSNVFVIAPLDANTLAKLAQGLCDNLLTCVARAWDPAKPLIFCPAMNTKMWEHPVTSEHIEKLKTWGYIEVPCISKTLMCGDSGLGAMAEVNTITDVVMQKLYSVCLSESGNTY